MIISCPSCNTRYRAAIASAPALWSAQCSRCDQVFPLDRPAQPYVLLGASTAAARVGPMSPRPAAMAIGMDDPGLAERLSHTAFDAAEAGNAAVLAYRVEAAEPAEAPAAEETGPETRRSISGGFLLPVLLTFAGAAAAWGVALGLNIVPWGATLAGAAAGLLASQLSWTWRRGKS